MPQPATHIPTDQFAYDILTMVGTGELIHLRVFGPTMEIARKRAREIHERLLFADTAYNSDQPE